MKKVILCTMLFLLVSLCCGCYEVYPYEGEHMDLATTLLCSIPGTRSNYCDQYLILEKDSYGRILFAAVTEDSYLKDNDLMRPSVCVVMIMQKSDEQYVYFYGEENYIFCLRKGGTVKLTAEFVDSTFTKEELESLKLANDWENPPEQNRRKCVKAPIVLESDYSSGDAAEKIIKKETGNSPVSIAFRQNTFGEKIIFLESEAPEDKMGYVVLLKEDGSFSGDKNAIMKLRGPEYLAEDMKTFMERNNWVDITE